MSRAAAARRIRVHPQAAAVIAYVGAVGMTATDNQIVNVALPSIGRGFMVPLVDVQWVVVGYALSLAIVMPASGWIGDRFGTRRTFLFALIGFTLASALCGLAGSLLELVGARVSQGICGGLLTPAGTAVLYRAFPPERRARLARLVIVPILVAPTVAPMLGGILTKVLSWRWVFYVNLPMGVILAFMIAAYLEEYREGEPGSLDILALIGSALGLTALLYGISEGATLGWGSPSIVGAGVLGVVVIVWFARRQLRSRHPVLDLRLLRDRLFRANIVLIGMSSAPFMGMLYLVPVFLQDADHASPIAAGSTVLLQAVGVLVVSQTLMRLYPRLGPRVMSTIGCAGVALVLAWMMLGSHSSNLWLLRVQMFLLGGTNSLALLSIQTSVFTNISHERTAQASAMFVTQRQIALAVGIAILTSVVATVHGSQIHRFHAAFFAAAVLATLATVSAFSLIHTVDALPSMRRSGAREVMEFIE